MGLLLFLKGYSSAAGLHGGREGGPIGRYKHSHRPIVLACTVIAYPSPSSRHRISQCRPQTKDAGVTHECNRAVAGSKERVTLISLPTDHDARSFAQDVQPAWRTSRVCRSRTARRGCCSARVLAQPGTVTRLTFLLLFRDLAPHTF